MTEYIIRSRAYLPQHNAVELYTVMDMNVQLF